MLNRLEVRSQVLECEDCDLHTRCTSPVPFFGPTPAAISVLGEAPGRDEDKQGRPFVGRAGQLLRRVLSEVGFDPEQLCWINTVSCFPTRADSGKGRTPLPSEVNACSANRKTQLELADSTWIILTGNVPLQAYRPDLRIGKAHGRPIRAKTDTAGDPPYFFPVYHPAAVLRNPAWEDDLKADLSHMKQLVEAGPAAMWSLTKETCVWCDVSPEEMEAWHCDNQGVPYCNTHWEARGGR